MLTKQIPIGIPYTVSRFKHHEQVKDKLLELIAESPSTNISIGKDSISRSDWHVPGTTDRPYWNFFEPLVYPHITEVFESIGHDDVIIDNYWFQQYQHNNTHQWHQHRGASYACVYYLQLPAGAPTTLVRDPMTGEEFHLDAKEGDIVTFPSIVWHTSPVNQSMEDKIVIAFNVE
jgi:hypothetical protein